MMVVTCLWYHTNSDFGFLQETKPYRMQQRLLLVPSGFGYPFYKTYKFIAWLGSNEPQPHNGSSLCAMSRGPSYITDGVRIQRRICLTLQIYCKVCMARRTIHKKSSLLKTLYLDRDRARHEQWSQYWRELCVGLAVVFCHTHTMKPHILYV